MATILKNVLQFTNLVIGVPTALPHKLNVNGIPVMPKIGGLDGEGFTISATATNVTVTRTINAESGDVRVYVEYWHTIESVTPLLPPPGKLIGLTPFFFAASGQDASPIVVEDDGVALPNPPHGILNFTGTGVTATDAGGGIAEINIPGNALDFQDDGVPIGPGPFTTANFTGAGVTTTDVGGGVAEINIPGLANVAPFIFVFNPFAVPGGNVYNNWLVLVAAMQAVDDYKVLQFDNTRQGTADTLTVPVAGTVRIHDPLGRFAPNMVTQTIMVDGATTPANNGPFIVTAFIDANNIDYTNAAGVAEPGFDGSWVVLGGGGTTACQIPPGIWDMTMTEWMGWVAPYAAAGQGGIRIEILDGASFENLRKISGECAVINLNNLPSRSPVVATANIVFELGRGPMGDRPSITNTGTTAFFDMSQMIAGQQLSIRSNGDMTGPNACVEMGNSPAQLNMNFEGEVKLRTGSVRGTNPAALINVAQRHALVEVGQFNTPTSPFAGGINYGKQQTNNGPNITRRLWTAIPQSANQQIPVASAVAFTTANLGHNHACEIVSAGPINQPLPLIRNTQLANATIAATTPGAINSTGMEVNFKQRGTGSINLWGDSPIPAQAAAVNALGGTFTKVGTTMTFAPSTLGLFTVAMIGRVVTFVGAPDSGNNGSFILTGVPNANTVTYENAAGVGGGVLLAPGTWRVGDTIDGLAAAIAVPAGGARTLLSDGVSNWRVIAGYL